jgi:hypothetical protein
MDRLGSNVMAQNIPYRWQIFDGERGYGLQGLLDSLFHTKNMILPNQNCDEIICMQLIFDGNQSCV